MHGDVDVRPVAGLGECEAGDLESSLRFAEKCAGGEFGRHRTNFPLSHSTCCNTIVLHDGEPVQVHEILRPGETG
jgi:hypothetical protein